MMHKYSKENILGDVCEICGIIRAHYISSLTSKYGLITQQDEYNFYKEVPSGLFIYLHSELTCDEMIIKNLLE
jgi:hypothetical protein